MLFGMSFSVYRKEDIYKNIPPIRSNDEWGATS